VILTQELRRDVEGINSPTPHPEDPGRSLDPVSASHYRYQSDVRGNAGVVEQHASHAIYFGRGFSHGHLVLRYHPDSGTPEGTPTTTFPDVGQHYFRGRRDALRGLLAVPSGIDDDLEIRERS